MRLINQFSQIKTNVSYALSWRKPILVYKLFRNMLRTLLGHKPLRGLDIVSSFACNMKCKHCNVAKMTDAKKTELTIEEWKNVVKQAERLGVVSFTITGGEPFLNPKFEEFIRTFKPQCNLMILQTSGFFVNEDAARWLKKIGIDICNVSLDSYDEKEHDESRGVASAYSRTIEAINACRKIGLKVMIGTVVSHKNIHSNSLLGLIEFANKEKILLLANLAVPIGRWSGNCDILLTPDDQSYVRELSRKYRFFRLDFNSNLLRYGCPAFKEKCYITPYGDVLGCTFVQISFGNIKEKSLEEIRNSGLKFEPFSRYNPFCSAAEDPEFNRKYMSIVQEAEILPVTIEETRRQCK